MINLKKLVYFSLMVGTSIAFDNVIIWSFPGSGNTWLRVILENMTGQKTLAIGDDRTLSTFFKYQLLNAFDTKNCAKASFIKAHPNLSNLNTGDLSSLCGGNVRKAIALIRNPFNSIWAEYQRQKAINGVNPHTKYILQRDWPSLEKHWQGFSLEYCKKWSAMWQLGTGQYADWIDKFGSDHLLIVKYEDLMDRSKRSMVVTRITSFAVMNQTKESTGASEEVFHRYGPPGSMTADQAWNSSDLRGKCSSILGGKTEIFYKSMISIQN